ncbi:hypothetical protein AA0X95_04840 [Bacillus sp. 1P10SD]|uniref:hypothetical protein n=1 Tax=Bacillus sp. 1P10SD TaxID=3132265 RepID=UPI0039A60174
MLKLGKYKNNSKVFEMKIYFKEVGKIDVWNILFYIGVILALIGIFTFITHQAPIFA